MVAGKFVHGKPAACLFPPIVDHYGGLFIVGQPTERSDRAPQGRLVPVLISFYELNIGANGRESKTNQLLMFHQFRRHAIEFAEAGKQIGIVEQISREVCIRDLRSASR